MSSSPRLIKGLVIVSSCLLVGGYLLYAARQTMMSGSKSARISTEDLAAAEKADLDKEVFTVPSGTMEKETLPAGPRAMMFSSKSGIATTPIGTTQPGLLFTGGQLQPAPATEADRRMMLAGSKSFTVLTPGMMEGSLTPPTTQPATQPVTQPATAPTSRRLIMGGSKSKQVFTPDDMVPNAPSPATQPAGPPTPRDMFPGSKSAPVFPQQR